MSTETRKIDPRISLFLVIIGMWLQFIHFIFLSFSISQMYIAYTGYIILFIALIVEVSNKSTMELRSKYRKWFICLILLGSFSLLYGIVKFNSLQFISRDIWPYSYFACFLLAARLRSWDYLDKMVYWQFIVGTSIVIFIWLTVDVSFNRIALSQLNIAWDGPRLYTSRGLLFGWQYMFLSYSSKHSKLRRMITVIGITLYIIIGLIMLKRQLFVDLGLLIIFKIYYVHKMSSQIRLPSGAWSKSSGIYSSFRILLLIVIIGLLISNVVQHYERIENVSYADEIIKRSKESGSLINTILENDRFYNTPLLIYNQAQPHELLIGQGLGVGIMRGTGKRDNSVESGFFTVFMKGGVIGILIWYWGLLMVLKDTFTLKKNDNFLFALLASLFILVSPVAPFFIMFPNAGYQMFWLGRVASKTA